MKINIVGPFKVNAPFATEIAFAKGLRWNGCDVVEFDPNVDDPDVLARDADFTLVFKSALSHNEVLRGMPRVVLYQPDDPRFPHIGDMLKQMRQYSDHLLLFRDLHPTYDREVIPMISSFGFTTVQALPVTADPELYYPRSDVKEDVDFCFVGSMGDLRCHWQRIAMCNAVRNRGYTAIVGTTQDMPLMMDTLARSRVVLNHSADPALGFGYGLGYQCRHFEVAFSGKCMLTNTVLDAGPDDVTGFVSFSDSDEFMYKADFLISNDSVRKKAAFDFYESALKTSSPKKRATQLIKKLEAMPW